MWKMWKKFELESLVLLDFLKFLLCGSIRFGKVTEEYGTKNTNGKKADFNGKVRHGKEMMKWQAEIIEDWNKVVNLSE